MSDFDSPTAQDSESVNVNYLVDDDTWGYAQYAIDEGWIGAPDIWTLRRIEDKGTFLIFLHGVLNRTGFWEEFYQTFKDEI